MWTWLRVALKGAWTGIKRYGPKLAEAAIEAKIKDKAKKAAPFLLLALLVSGPVSAQVVQIPGPYVSGAGVARGALIQPDGTYLSSDVATGLTHLSDSRAMLGRIAASTASSQYKLAIIGDSWMINGAPFTTALQTYMLAQYGSITGRGFVSFVQVAPAGVTVASAGTWTARNKTGDVSGLTLTDVTSTDTATPASKTLTTTAVTTGVTQTFVIHYLKQPNGGTFTWAIDGGAATPVDTANATAEFASVTISGQTAAAHSLVLTVTVAGTAGVRLYGVDMQTSANGVQLHSIANSGSQGSHWVAADATIWEAGLTALAPNAVLISLGVNEKANDVVPATYGANLQTLVSRVRVALPYADIVLCAPPENGDTNLYAMNLYADQARSVAYANNAALVDWYAAYGSYALTNSHSLWLNTIHPNAAGAQVLTDILVSGLFPRATNNPYSQTIGAGGLSMGGNLFLTTGSVYFTGSGSIQPYADGVFVARNAGTTGLTTWWFGPPTGNSVRGSAAWNNGLVTINMATATGTGTGTITSPTTAIPAGVYLGMTCKVTTILAGAGLTTISVGDGTDADRWGTGIAIAAGTTINVANWTAAPPWTYAAATSIVVTADAGVLSTGVLSCTPHSFTFTVIGS